MDGPDFLIVAIGASAGGLAACIALVSALPAPALDHRGMAFILVQHLDPTHPSMLAELLGGHTAMVVREVADGMPIAPGCIYVIPPARYLTVRDGLLKLSAPHAPRGARLPFDFLLDSLASGYGARVVCVVLSGTGKDGSRGLVSVKRAGGRVIVQDPDEAAYPGMPREAIQTGEADLILAAAAIPAALADYGKAAAALSSAPVGPENDKDRLTAIIELMRTRTAHDFSLYKRGTMQRRVERRMAMAGIGTDALDTYVALLRDSPHELDELAKSLLINVTSFFRDPRVFDLLAETIVPELVTGRAADRPIRIWIVGCSTGEETYSLAMLFRERIAAEGSEAKLQIFASDVDADAVAEAREGLYPAAIETDVSAARLARFFTKEDGGWRVSPELRALVVFAVQNVLSDPPFSRLDFISCRNLLIYLRPDAQAKVISLFHFALREGGVLLLGGAETAGGPAGRFKLISKPGRLYRHVGRASPGELGKLTKGAANARIRVPAAAPSPVAATSGLADFGRRMVLDAYAPAAILINGRHECLFSMGPTDRYLRVPSGHPTHDLLAMARPGLRARLRSAIHQAVRQQARATVPGGRTVEHGRAVSFVIEVTPAPGAGEDVLLVCFLDQPAHDVTSGSAAGVQGDARFAALQHELATTRAELHGAIQDLEQSGEEQKAINEEALSVNEEYQSSNEELLTSKEELQSLNEELTALNSQLQETLDRQRTTSDDLQNVLYSTDIATLFLDADLKIRFFTPATKSLFAVIPGDVGRPLADLRALAPDAALPDDARAVLKGRAPIDREIQTPDGEWFRRRILPYHTHDGRVEGVVITFTDITRRKRAAVALEDAKQQAEAANAAKSRFLAAASHDLRQPLQTLSLLQGLLARSVEGERSKTLVARLDETLGAMSGMLNTLLDINQIEAGAVRADIADVALDELLATLRSEFAYHAAAKGIGLRVIACGLHVRSDARLLEQMLRNLLSNAIKYTARGKVLVGCRRRGDVLGIEVWDTGAGIPDSELAAIFEEYHQIGNAARERSQGLGLGLSIVNRLGALLGHRVHVRSRHGRGSMFRIDVPRSSDDGGAGPEAEAAASTASAPSAAPGGSILVVEDDRELRDLLDLFLADEGHCRIIADEGAAALALVAGGAGPPDVVLTDYNLPGGMSGLQLAARLRQSLGQRLPVVILTGDTSSETRRDIEAQGCVGLSKPVSLTELSGVIRSLLPARTVPAPSARLAPARGPAPADTAGVVIIDDDDQVRGALRSLIEDAGRSVADYASGEAFLAAYQPGSEACLLIDAYLPGMSGIALLRRLRADGRRPPAVMITGSSDVHTAVEAMKAGASDFIEKPVGRDELLACIDRAIEQSLDLGKRAAWRDAAAVRLKGLIARQRKVLAMVLAGQPSKNIAADLGISQRTVENHRAAIMKRTGSASLPALARLALAAAEDEAGATAAER